MKLFDLAKNEVQEEYARILEELCVTLSIGYEIDGSSFGFDIIIKSMDRKVKIYCCDSSCLDEFSKFLQGYIFAMDIARKKYNHY